MIDNILSSLTEVVRGLKIYSNVFCLAELSVDGEGKKQPKAYDTDGQLKNVSDFDLDGVGYFRHDGEMTITNEALFEITSSCADSLLFDYPMKFVGVVRKDKFTDNAFTDDTLALRLVGAIEKRYILGNDAAFEFSVERINTDSISILSEEYEGIERKDFDYNLSYVAVYFRLRVSMNKSCLPKCEALVTDFRIPQGETLCEAIEDCEVITNLQAQIDACCAQTNITLTNTHILVGNAGNVATDVPLSLSAVGGAFSLANTGVLIMPNADAATRGLLLAADWVTFNAKQQAFANLTSIGSLANAVGWLHNDGAGNFVYSTPAGVVTNVTATAPITSSGGATPDISTSMNTNKLIGRGTAGVGVMEEITLGTNLSFTGTTLNATGGSTTFIGLTDVPASYVGASLKAVRVNVGETALEFYTPTVGTVTSVSGTLNRITSTGGATPVIDIDAAYDALWQPIDADLTAIAALGFASTSFLKKTAANTWALDTNVYLTSAAQFISSVTDTNSIDLTVAAGVLTADSKISATAGNIITINADGLYATTAADFITSITDTNSINLTVGAGALSADIVIQNTATVNLSVDGSGLKADFASMNISQFTNNVPYLVAADITGFATRALNNLLSVAINTTLVSDTDATDDLGTTLLRWNNIFGVNLGATGTRFTTGWFTDLTVTNAIAGSVTGNAGTITVANEATDATCFIGFYTAASGSLAGKTNANLTFDSNTGIATFGQTIVGSITGNAATATALQNARTIGGTSFDGTANIVPDTINSVNEATDTTCFPLFITASGTQALQPKNNTSLTFNSNTANLGCTTFTGALVGNSDTATVSTTSTLANEATDTTCFLVFGTAATGNLGLKTNANLAFNSNTGVLTLTAPVLGTPTSGTLTNCTGLPEGGLSLTDITTNNVSNTVHGFFPKLTANTVYYVSNAGALVALALGAATTVLTSNGVASAPTFSAAAGGGITIGTTTITSGTNTRILYNNAGVVGEYTLTGTGTIAVMAASPALTGTPKAPTAAVGTNTTQIATTAFVQAELTDFDFLMINSFRVLYSY